MSEFSDKHHILRNYFIFCNSFTIALFIDCLHLTLLILILIHLPDIFDDNGFVLLIHPIACATVSLYCFCSCAICSLCSLIRMFFYCFLINIYNFVTIT